MDDSFTKLAKRIRTKKYNKKEIENIKKEAIESKIERNRRINKAIYIQKITRGFLSRKKFKILEEKLNINTIIDYLYEKKCQRIDRHAPKIISYFVLKYIERQRKIKIRIINEFRVNCCDLIKAFLKGIIVRKKIKNDLEKIRSKKKIIKPYILSFRTRLMLKCVTLQNILTDIANIKFLINDEKELYKNDNDNYHKQNIKELNIKLRKKYNEFYLIFYQYKVTSEWVDEERTSEPWFKKYQQIINGEEEIVIPQKKTKKNNNNFDNNIDLNNLNNLNHFEQEENDINKNNFTQNNENYDNNYNYENNNNYEDEQNNVPYPQKQYMEDERPIKPLKNNNFMNNDNPFGLSNSGFPENHSNHTNNIKKANIKSQKKTNNEEIFQNQKEESKQNNNNPYNEYDERPIKNNNNIPYNDYDERPIGGGKKIDYNEMFGNGKNFEGDGFGGQTQKLSQKKIIRNKNSPPKKPVYDSRKAIEEAKLKEAKEGKKEKPSAFREFVREMKKISAEEKSGNVNNNSNKKITNLKNINVNDKESEYSNKEKENIEKNKNKKIQIHKKVETEKMALRRRLHELERSPPPILNIKDAKSKIECWGPSNDVKRQNGSPLKERHGAKHKTSKNNNKNTINFSLKEINNIASENKLNSITNINNYNSINVSKKPKIEDSKKLEEKAKKIAGKKLAKIENQISRLNSSFNLNNYFKQKEKKMKDYSNIPYIKQEYNYVKKYSNEVYDNLVTHLLAQYQDLK